MKIIIPMAGLGSRFKKVADTNPEYHKPKPLIDVRGLPMIRWATGSLPFVEHPGQKVNSPIKVTMSDLVFVILEEHDEQYGLEKKLREIYSDAIQVIKIPKLTRGAAETAYQAKPFVGDDEAVLITDSDHYFDGKLLEEMIVSHQNQDIAGGIPVFIPPADNIPRWSYSLLQGGGNEILQVGEKDRALMEAGALANIGAYYFAKARYFFDQFEKNERESKMSGEIGKQEFYVAPIYQDLLNDGKRLKAAVLPEVWGLGTPTDLEYFLEHCPVTAPGMEQQSSTTSQKELLIVVPMAGLGTKFKEAGYAFPKPLIDIGGQTMVELVVKNLKPSVDHKFIFICQKELYENYDLYNIFKKATNDKFEVVQIYGQTEGATCTVLSAIEHINNDQEMIIANADQFLDLSIDDFISQARSKSLDGSIMTFHASHPKWSYARTDETGKVLETAEKKVISENATVGIYYFKKGRDFVQAAQAMILRNIRHNNEFYVCPVYNELILAGANVRIFPINAEKMHSLGTPEDVSQFVRKVEEGKIAV